MAVSTDWRRARLAPADHAMLEFSEKLTINPSTMAERDVVKSVRDLCGELAVQCQV